MQMPYRPAVSWCTSIAPGRLLPSNTHQRPGGGRRCARWLVVEQSEGSSRCYGFVIPKGTNLFNGEYIVVSYITSARQPPTWHTTVQSAAHYICKPDILRTVAIRSAGPLHRLCIVPEARTTLGLSPTQERPLPILHSKDRV